VKGVTAQSNVKLCIKATLKYQLYTDMQFSFASIKYLKKIAINRAITLALSKISTISKKGN